MTLSALINKGGITKTATATPATQETEQKVTVASHPEPLNLLLPNEEAIIRAWLVRIEENDPAIIAEVLDKCFGDLEARRYFLKQSEEVSEPVTSNNPVTCGTCTHFERINHPNLGHCAKGKLEAIAGLWDTSQRYCGRYLSRPKQPTWKPIESESGRNKNGLRKPVECNE